MTTIPGAETFEITLDIRSQDIDDLLDVTPDDVSSPAALTFAKNIFLPLTTACRYTCTYCTYFDSPGNASLLSPEEIRTEVRRGVNVGCTEALFTFGDDPDSRYTQIHDQLAEWGHDSIHSYLREACEIALDEGILPHSNPGDQTYQQMEMVADVNASMGVMLETTADVDAHAGSRTKLPGQRLNTIRNAGELEIPFTTGILVGIGEDWTDRAESLLAIRELHERYGHVQEVIVQPVVENERWQSGSPNVETLRRVVAMARTALPENISVQVPPNLAPVREVIDCGVDDLGGVSPVTDDYINPEYKWPALRELEAIAEDASLPLSERLPVHERFIDDPEHTWLSSVIRTAIRASDDAGTRYRRVLG